MLRVADGGDGGGVGEAPGEGVAEAVGDGEGLGDGEGVAPLKAAETVRSASIGTVHATVPVQLPPQPRKVRPELGAAVRDTLGVAAWS